MTAVDMDALLARARQLVAGVVDAASLAQAELIATRVLIEVYHEGERAGLDLLDAELTKLESRKSEVH
jgi:hypothetical protein